MISQAPETPQKESQPPAPETKTGTNALPLSQRLVRLAGLILILIVVGRGLILLIGRGSTANPPPAVTAISLTGSPSANGTSLPGPNVKLPLAISAANVDHIAPLASWGQGALRAAYFAPDGSQFALLTTLDLRLYDAATFQLLRSFPIDDFNVAVAISPDWQKFVVCVGNTLKIFALEDGQLLATLHGSPGRVTSPAFSPDGSLLANVAMPPGDEVYTGAVELWRISDGRLLNSWEAGASALAFSLDGRSLATWYAMTGIRLWGLPDGNSLSHIDSSAPNAVLFLPDGQSLAAAEMDGKIHRYRAADGSQIDAIPASLPGINSLRLAPDGQTLAALAGNGQVALWRLPEWQPLNDLHIQTNPQGAFAFTPHNGQALTASNGAVVLWSLSDGQRQTILSGFYPPVRRLAFLADSKGLAILSEGGMDGIASLQVRSIPDGSLQCGLDGLSALSLAASQSAQDGGRLALGTSDGWLFLLRAAGCVELKSAKAYQQQVQDVSFAAGEPLLASSSMMVAQVIYYQEPFQLMGLFDVPDGWVTPVRFNHAGNAIAAVSAGGKVYVWDYPAGRLLYSLDSGEDGYAASLAFTPDDDQLVSGAHNRLQVWHTSDGGRTADWDVGDWVQALAVSPDGSLLAVGLANGQIQLRSLADGSLLRTLQAHHGPLSDLAISPNGRYLASAGQDGAVHLWGLPAASP